MAKISGKNAKVLHNSTEITEAKDWSLDWTCDTVDVTSFISSGDQSTAKDYLAGLTDWNGTITCVLDSTGIDLTLGTSYQIKFYVNATKYFDSGASGCFVSGISPSVAKAGEAALTYNIQGTSNNGAVTLSYN